MLMLHPFAPFESYVTRTSGQVGFLPPADVELGENETVLSLDLPGLSEQDLEIEALDGELIVRGDRKAPELPEGSTWVHSERLFGSFERRIGLPKDTDPDAITASMADGVLTLRVPKPARSTPKTIAIGSARRELESAAA